MTTKPEAVPPPATIIRSKRKLADEFFALRKILKALEPLDADQTERVWRYLHDFAGLPGFVPSSGWQEYVQVSKPRWVRS